MNFVALFSLGNKCDFQISIEEIRKGDVQAGSAQTVCHTMSRKYLLR